jgi:hypothetical protein
MKKSLLVFTLFSGLLTFAQNCSDLFISEYVEGWSNNKALEIYNPTSTAINLSNYFVARYSNGSTTATGANAIQLNGTVAPFDVYVAVLDKQDPNGTGQEAPVWDSLLARADGFYAPVYNTNNSFYWNGNDAVMLGKGTLSSDPTANVTTATGFAIVDIFGKIGENPANASGVASANDGAWSTGFPYSSGQGVLVTSDHSLLRKASIQKGVATQVSFFNPLAEWDSIPAVIVRVDPATGDTILGSTGNPILDGNWNSLGIHSCECAPAAVQTIKQNTELSIFPNPTSGIVYLKGASMVEKVLVYNALGQLVESVNNNSKSVLSIDLGTMKGLYLLKITDASGEQITKRVIVK